MKTESNADFDDQLQLKFERAVESKSGVWYKVLQPLGRGGSAATYLVAATSGPTEGWPFAAKFFRRISMPDRLETFHEEIRFLKECQHPGILRVFDEGVYEDVHPFVVSEFLPKTLRVVIREKSMTLVEKVSISLQLLSTLEYLSSLKPQVIHRDIKPDNIFLKGPTCVLGDFGLMKRLDGSAEPSKEENLKQSVGPGMPFYYRTPDLVAYLRDSEPTTKSDVFQMGLVLANLFSGRNPQRKAEHNNFLSDVVLDAISEIPGSHGSPIENLITSMLETKPENRPTPAELLPSWFDLFFAAAQSMNALEGRVF